MYVHWARLVFCYFGLFKASSMISADLYILYTVRKPLTHRYQKCNCDMNFWRYVMACSTRNVIKYCLGVLQHENRTQKKKILKYYITFFFYQFIRELFSSHSAFRHLYTTQHFGENFGYIKFCVVDKWGNLLCKARKLQINWSNTRLGNNLS